MENERGETRETVREHKTTKNKQKYRDREMERRDRPSQRQRAADRTHIDTRKDRVRTHEMARDEENIPKQNEGHRSSENDDLRILGCCQRHFILRGRCNLVVDKCNNDIFSWFILNVFFFSVPSICRCPSSSFKTRKQVLRLTSASTSKMALLMLSL